MKIMKAIRTDVVEEEDGNIHVIRGVLKELAARIQPLSIRQPECIGLSNKARFTFLDIYENIQKIA